MLIAILALLLPVMATAGCYVECTRTGKNGILAGKTPEKLVATLMMRAQPGYSEVEEAAGITTLMMRGDLTVLENGKAITQICKSGTLMGINLAQVELLNGERWWMVKTLITCR